MINLGAPKLLRKRFKTSMHKRPVQSEILSELGFLLMQHATVRDLYGFLLFL